jgi:hypothetical protein
MTRAVSFSDSQLTLLKQAAKQVPFPKRGDFLLSVARSLSGNPSDQALCSAITRALDGIMTEQTNDPNCC